MGGIITWLLQSLMIRDDICALTVALIDKLECSYYLLLVCYVYVEFINRACYHSESTYQTIGFGVFFTSKVFPFSGFSIRHVCTLNCSAFLTDILNLVAIQIKIRNNLETFCDFWNHLDCSFDVPDHRIASHTCRAYTHV